ncbi:MAG: NADPH-dependent glutamate synthase [Candidatus Hodarchaeota archaeon]
MADEKKKDVKLRQTMPCQDPAQRSKNFDEVALGFTEEQAVEEANRCLKCKKSPCITGCPVDIDINQFLELTSQRKFKEALEVIKEKNNLPGITGRVCPQESQCEAMCTLGKGKAKSPLAIGAIERFVADWCDRNGVSIQVKMQPRNHVKVAVVGSGPAGLTAAGDLAIMGYDVTIFECFSDGGGVLIYGIPEFRLPKSILKKEIEYLESLGVSFQFDTIVGKTLYVEELFEMGYQAVFLGTGAGLPRFMNIPGENLNDVYSANEFLTRVNLMKAYKFPEYDTPVKIGDIVAVVGGGNVAMDSARTALRLGAKEVRLLYRRSRAEMPARHAEIEHAEEEGIKFHFLWNPVEIIGDENGDIVAVKCQEMTLGCLDDSGRASCLPVEGSFKTFDINTMIMAIGSNVNEVCSKATCGLEVNRRGHILVNEENQETSLEGVFAAGDAVTGGATVISAMGNAKKAASAIDAYLKQKHSKSTSHS